MFRVDFEYSIGDQVLIIDLDNKPAVVTSLWYGDRGPLYEVAYFCDGDRHKEYLFACELQLRKNLPRSGFVKE
jgi:hypothetical protein